MQEYDQFQVVSKTALSDNQCNEILLEYNSNLEKIQQQDDRKILKKLINIYDIKNLKNMIFSANNETFKFNLYHDIECYFGRYDVGMHYQSLHYDHIPGNRHRKLTFTLLLNDDFKGGEFKMINGIEIPPVKGKLLVFPSFLAHQVLPVTENSRCLIFGWVHGPPFC